MVICSVELLAVEMVMMFFGEIEIKNREIPQNDQFKYHRAESQPQVYSVLVLNKNFVQQPITSFLYMCDQNNIQKLNILSERLFLKGNWAKSTRPQNRKVSQQFLSF